MLYCGERDFDKIFGWFLNGKPYVLKGANVEELPTEKIRNSIFNILRAEEDYPLINLTTQDGFQYYLLELGLREFEDFVSKLPVFSMITAEVPVPGERVEVLGSFKHPLYRQKLVFNRIKTLKKFIAVEELVQGKLFLCIIDDETLHLGKTQLSDNVESRLKAQLQKCYVFVSEKD